MQTKDLNTISFEFENKLHTFMEEVLCAEDCYYTSKTIHVMASENGAIHRALNRNGFFWQRTINSLEVNLIMTIGRIFDSRNDSFSIFQLLHFCKTNKEVFSKYQLEKRKSKDLNPEQLREYMKDKPEEIVSIKDLEEIESKVNFYKDIFNKKYIQIRSAIFGHKSLKIIDKEDALFSKTSTDELEAMLDFLNRVSIAMWELYNNGRNIKLNNTEPSHDFKNMIVQDVQDVLTRLIYDNGEEIKT